MSSNPGGLFSSLAPWLGALVGLVIVGGIVLVWIRRAVHRDASAHDVGFTLQDLRNLRDRGELSDEEFERARERMVQRLTQPSGNLGAERPDSPDDPRD